MTRRKFGTIIAVSEGRWRVKWRDPQGRQRTHRLEGTFHDAELYLAKVEMQRFGADAGVTYRTYWDNVVDPQIEGLQEKTRHWYRSLWAKHLEPAIGSRLVASTTYAFAQGVIDGVEAPTVQRAVARLWAKVCNMAVRDGILPANPVQRMAFKPATRREKTILGRDGTLPHVDACAGSKYAHLVALELLGGLRHEEACAVTRDDVTEDGGNVLVSVSKARVSINGRMVEKGCKNAYSVRTVPFSGICAEKLRCFDVHPVNPETATRNFKAWCARRGLPWVPFGNMRSNFATVAGECCDGSLLDLFMGHSGRTTTDKWYRSGTPDGMLRVARSYAEYLLGDEWRDTPLGTVNCKS